MRTLEQPLRKSEKLYRVCEYCGEFQRDCHCPDCWTGGSS